MQFVAELPGLDTIPALPSRYRDRRPIQPSGWGWHIEHVGEAAKLEFVTAKTTITAGTYKNVSVKGFSSLDLVFKANSTEWTLHIDDGAFLDGKWCLTDDLVALENDKKLGCLDVWVIRDMTGMPF